MQYRLNHVHNAARCGSSPDLFVIEMRCETAIQFSFRRHFVSTRLPNLVFKCELCTIVLCNQIRGNVLKCEVELKHKSPHAANEISPLRHVHVTIVNFAWRWAQCKHLFWFLQRSMDGQLVFRFVCVCACDQTFGTKTGCAKSTLAVKNISVFRVVYTEATAF